MALIVNGVWSPTGGDMGLRHMPVCPSEDACQHAEYAARLAILCSCGCAVL